MDGCLPLMKTLEVDVASLTTLIGPHRPSCSPPIRPPVEITYTMYSERCDRKGDRKWSCRSSALNP